MLLTDFRAVVEIDDQISKLHKKLGSLYEVRARYIHETSLASNTFSAMNLKHHTQAQVEHESLMEATDWTINEQQKLSQIWSKYGIQFPQK